MEQLSVVPWQGTDCRLVLTHISYPAVCKLEKPALLKFDTCFTTIDSFT